MHDAKEAEFSLKFFIDNEKSKVLFAEADNDFADVLLSFLWLPLGKIVKILEKHYGDNAPSMGSLTTLYNGLKNPENVTLWTKFGKDVLNNPRSGFTFSQLKVSFDYADPSRYKFGESYDGCFTQNSASFIVSDDLRMFPNVSGSIMQTLSKFGIDIADMNKAEMRNVTFGLKEVIELLKGSLFSPTPLSDLVFGKVETKLDTTVSEAGVLMHDQLKKDADEDFVDFLFSLLIIPLGRVEWLLGSNTSLSNIDNLHRSIGDHIDDKYLVLAKELAMKSKVDALYTFKHCLPLCNTIPRMSPDEAADKPFFVGGSRMYMVTDDLIVTRLCVSSTVSLLNEMNISLSDVEEVEHQIGLEEALNVLKASLTSTCALTDGLINPKLLKKKPQQEHELSLIILGSFMLLFTLVVIFVIPTLKNLS